MTVKGSSFGLPQTLSPPNQRTAPASQALSGHRVVILTAAGLAYPDLANVEHADAIAGVTVSAASQGAATIYQNDGAMSDPSWAWSIGPLFCGPSGVLVQSPPAGAWLRQIGEALSPTSIIIHLFPSYYLRGA